MLPLLLKLSLMRFFFSDRVDENSNDMSFFLVYTAFKSELQCMTHFLFIYFFFFAAVPVKVCQLTLRSLIGFVRKIW